MSEPFLAEIRIVGFNFAPRGWAFCDGQILPISQNQSLYSLLGTTYGGDGRTTFALPDLRSRTPIHRAAGFSLGQKGGDETVTLTEAQMPSHRHLAKANSGAVNAGPLAGNTWGQATDTLYSNEAPDANMNGDILGRTGGGMAHNNMQPYLTLGFVIALQGLFPSRN